MTTGRRYSFSGNQPYREGRDEAAKKFRTNRLILTYGKAHVKISLHDGKSVTLGLGTKPVRKRGRQGEIRRASGYEI